MSLHRGPREADKAQLAHLPGNPAASPAAILARQTQHGLLRLGIGLGAPGSALGAECPVAADDLPMPAYEGGRLDDHQAVQQLCLLHSDAREQQSQLLGAAQPRALPQLTLEDEDLVAQGEGLAVTTDAQ